LLVFLYVAQELTLFLISERRGSMRPRERREGGEQDLFRSRLDQIIDMEHALVKLARAIDWRFHRVERNYLHHRHGDANAILAAVGYNFRLLIRWLKFLLRLVLTALTPTPGSVLA
jgi:hypothetical protein